MYPVAARRALARRLDALSRNLPLALTGDVEGVHRARVASRRLRELLAVLAPGKGADDRKTWRATVTRVRAVTRALGGVRELDVALELLAEILAGEPALTPPILAARSAIEQARAALLDPTHDELADVEVGKLAVHLERLVSVRGAGRHRVELFGLRDRLRENAVRLDEAVAAAGALFALDRLHDVRIAAKKLRYALELAEELVRVGTKRHVDRLREAQDLLGRMHDLGILAAHVRRVNTSRAGAGDVKPLVDRIDREIHSLHAAYIARSAAIAGVIRECRGSLSGRVEARLSRATPPSAATHLAE
jgi:CHAD domain-containing protein